MIKKILLSILSPLLLLSAGHAEVISTCSSHEDEVAETNQVVETTDAFLFSYANKRFSIAKSVLVSSIENENLQVAKNISVLTETLISDGSIQTFYRDLSVVINGNTSDRYHVVVVDRNSHSNPMWSAMLYCQ